MAQRNLPPLLTKKTYISQLIQFVIKTFESGVATFYKKLILIKNIKIKCVGHARPFTCKYDKHLSGTTFATWEKN